VIFQEVVGNLKDPYPDLIGIQKTDRITLNLLTAVRRKESLATPRRRNENINNFSLRSLRFKRFKKERYLIESLLKLLNVQGYLDHFAGQKRWYHEVIIKTWLQITNRFLINIYTKI
jgi:hypothetical protein